MSCAIHPPWSGSAPGTRPAALIISCHDPHNGQYGNFLVMDNTASACASTATPRINGPIPSTPPPRRLGTAAAESLAAYRRATVAVNGCENCHSPHAAGTPARLLNFTPDEQNCYSCHSGTVAAKNIAAEFNTKESVHPIALLTGIHGSHRGRDLMRRATSLVRITTIPFHGGCRRHRARGARVPFRLSAVLTSSGRCRDSAASST